MERRKEEPENRILICELREEQNVASKVKLMECKSCAAHFDEMLPACPYCGTASIKGAQAQYLDKLEEIRSDVEELEAIPADVIKKELKKPFIIVFVVIIICIAFLWVGFLIDTKTEEKPKERDSKGNYAWLQENTLILNELYEKGDYEQLLELFEEAVAGEKPIQQWEHYEFCTYLKWYFDVKEIFDRETSGKELSKYDYKTLLYMYYRTPWIMESALISQEEKDKLRPYAQMLEADYKTRWNFTQEESDMLEQGKEEDGYLSYEAIEPVVEVWMKRNNK